MNGTEKEKISIIIPVYNSRQTVERCVRSLLGQSYENKEIIAVDCGSDDGSYSLLSELFGSEDQFRLILNDRKPGIASAVNKGLEAADGDFLVIMMPGDHADEGMLRSLAAPLAANDAGVMMCGIKQDRGRGRKTVTGTAEEFISDTASFIDMMFAELYDKGLTDILSNKMFSLRLMREKCIFPDERLSDRTALREFFFRILGNSAAAGIIKGAPLDHTGKLSLQDTGSKAAGLSESVAYLKAYDFCFNSVLPGRRAVNRMNNRMISSVLSDVKRFYRMCSGCKKECMEESDRLFGNREYLELLTDTFPVSPANLPAVLLGGFYLPVRYRIVCFAQSITEKIFPFSKRETCEFDPEASRELWESLKDM